MKNLPKIEKYMTTTPHTIGSDIPIKKAFEMMRQHNIRHLPVQKGGALVGVLTDRDIKLASSFQKGNEELNCEDVMTPDPYTVSPEANLDHVVSDMAEHKYGCAIVLHKSNQYEHGKVVGIFTANDGLKVLAEVLVKNYK